MNKVDIFFAYATKMAPTCRFEYGIFFWYDVTRDSVKKCRLFTYADIREAHVAEHVQVFDGGAMQPRYFQMTSL